MHHLKVLRITNDGFKETAAGTNMNLRAFHSLRSSDLLLLTVVCAAVFTDIFLYGLLVPVLPFALTQRAGIPPSDVARWNGILLALYNLGLCIGSPLAGLYADHSSSRKMPFLLGLVSLAGSTLLLCLGRTVVLLAVGRVLQGASAAICWAVGLALVADAMAKRMGWAAGWVNGAMTVGFLLSPIVGGVAYARAGYYAVYYMAFGLIAVDVAMRLLLKRRETPREATPLPDSHPYLSLIKSRRLLMSLAGCAMQSASK